MKCNRCERDEGNVLRRMVWCPDSRRPITYLCLVCWGDLQIWLKHPPARFMELLMSGEGGQVDHARPMGVSDDS